MTEDDINTDQTATRWFVDLSWYPQRERTISALLQDCLCDGCRKKLSKGSNPPPDSELITRLRECCKNNADFITGQMPILESIFRFFIASGNEPMTVSELGRQLSESRGGDISRTSEEILLRLLKNDRYYGFRPVAD
jgi:hypothetical protein